MIHGLTAHDSSEGLQVDLVLLLLAMRVGWWHVSVK